MIGISNLYLILLPIISSFLIGGWIGTPSLWGCAGFLYKKDRTARKIGRCPGSQGQCDHPLYKRTARPGK